jgi:hypothetical protein
MAADPPFPTRGINSLRAPDVEKLYELLNKLPDLRWDLVEKRVRSKALPGWKLNIFLKKLVSAAAAEHPAPVPGAQLIPVEHQPALEAVELGEEPADVGGVGVPLRVQRS